MVKMGGTSMENNLKSTGMVRRVDELGRIVLPKELRKVLGIEKKDPLEIFTSGENIVLKKYEPFCIFCGSSSDLVAIDDKNVCSDCVKKLYSNLK